MPEQSTPNPDQPDGDKDASGAPDGDKNKNDTISRSEFERAARDRDKAKDERRKALDERDRIREESATRVSELEARLKEIEDGKTAAEEDAARKSGDVEKLQTTWNGQRSELQKQIEAERKAREKETSEWQAKHDSLATRYQRNLVERTLLEELTALSTNPKAELVFLQKEYQFEPIEDDDGLFTGVKSKDSEKTVGELHKEICEKYGLPFEKNDRANGSGAQQTNGSDGTRSATSLPANFDKKSKADQQKWFNDNPNFKLG